MLFHQWYPEKNYSVLNAVKVICLIAFLKFCPKILKRGNREKLDLLGLKLLCHMTNCFAAFCAARLVKCMRMNIRIDLKIDTVRA